MSLSALIAALLLERYRPALPVAPRETARRAMQALLSHLDAGGEQHGALAWSLGVALPALLVAGLASLLHGIGSLLGWAFEVVVLAFCLGFRQASYQVAQLARLLRDDSASEAAAGIFRTWRPGLLLSADSCQWPTQIAEEIVRQGLVRLLGVVFWFVLLGAGGAVLYALSGLARVQWAHAGAFGAFSARARYALDWLPVRLAAVSFAVVGNFQDALTCWREQSDGWSRAEPHEGQLLAAAAGALGLQLGGPLTLRDSQLPRHVLGVGEPPEADALEGVVALLWRVVALWGAALGLVWLGSL